MKHKIFPLPPGVWFGVICLGIVVFFIMLKPAEYPVDTRRDPRQTIQEAMRNAKERANRRKPVIKQTITEGTELVSGVEFYGDSLAAHTFQEGLIMFEGAGNSRWAYALVQFAKPVDFFTSTLTFLAKAGGSAEAMEVGFTDADRRTTPKDEILDLALSDEYQKISIRGKDIQSISMNKSKVAALKISWRAADPANEDLRIYIKDLQCIQNEEYLDVEEKKAENESLLER